MVLSRVVLAAGNNDSNINMVALGSDLGKKKKILYIDLCCSREFPGREIPEMAKNSRFKRELLGNPGKFRDSQTFYPFPFPGSF
jgi:hypothetical protein